METYFEFLPNELLDIVIHYLTYDDVDNLILSAGKNNNLSKSLKMLHNDEYKYQLMLYKDFPGLYSCYRNRIRYKLYGHHWKSTINILNAMYFSPREKDLICKR